jgi:hypothetical protein
LIHVHPAKGQELMYEMGSPGSGGFQPDPRVGTFPIGYRLREDVRLGRHYRKGRAQLVRRIGDEIALRRDLPAQLRGPNLNALTFGFSYRF